MKEKKVTLYAPCDCNIKAIEKCSDASFASKALGDGVLITPPLF